MTLYPATREIAKILDIYFTFPLPKGQQRISNLPEIALISLLVIAVKLYHPFFSHQIYADENDVMSLYAIDWDAWVKSHHDHESRLSNEDQLARGTEMEVTENDAMTMTGDQLDDYLDWYERTWVDEGRAERKPKALPKQLLDMFPTGRQDGTQPRPYNYQEEMDKEQGSKAIQIEETMANLRLRKAKDDGHPTRSVGSMYKRYRTESDLSSQARIFHKAVAKLAAIKLESLLTAILQIEYKLLAGRQRELRGEGAAVDESSDEGDD